MSNKIYFNIMNDEYVKWCDIGMFKIEKNKKEGAEQTYNIKIYTKWKVYNMDCYKGLKDRIVKQLLESGVDE